MEKQEHEYALGVRVHEQLLAEEESINERKKNIMLVNNQIKGWMSRVSNKLADLTDDIEGAAKLQKQPMVGQFRYIAEKVTYFLQQIK